MLAGEIQVLKDLVDQELPKIEAAEVSRLPAAYQPIVTAVMAALGPALQVELDKLVTAIPVSTT
jgi:hypothetical protein